MFNPKYQILYADKESGRDSFGIHCKKLLKKEKIDVGEIALNSIPDVPIWDSEPVTVDFTLSKFDNHLLLLFLKVSLMRLGRNTWIFVTYTLTDLKKKQK